MAKKNKVSVYDIHGEADTLKYLATKPNAKVTQGKNHVRVEGDNHKCTFLPRHRGDYATGTRHAIIKQLIAIGLGILAWNLVF